MEAMWNINEIIKRAIMEGIGLYSQYFIKMGIKIKALFSSPSGTIAGASLVGVSVLSSVQMALLLLLGLYLFDFITGIGASWIEKSKLEKVRPVIKERNLISSEKLKLSLVKAFTYTSTILAINMVERVFSIKPYLFPSVSEVPMTITLIFIGLCCSIEFYSIFFENFKRMGFDIPQKIKEAVKGLKSFFSEVKKEE